MDVTPCKPAKKSRSTERAVAVVIEQRDPRVEQQGSYENLQHDEAEAKVMDRVSVADADMGQEAENPTKSCPKINQQRLVRRPKSSDFISSEDPLEVKAFPNTSRTTGTLTRFDNDDINALIREESAKSQKESDEIKLQSNRDPDSDDDAPEEATTAAGHDRVAAAATKATELAAKEKAARKAKRREHEELMRAQAEGVEKPGSRKEAQPADSKTKAYSKDGETGPKRKKSTKAPLPILLPDEILNAQPTTRAPTPPVAIARVAPNTKKLLFNNQDKAPKDLVHGNTRIRVLQDDRTLLPPKSSTKGRNIREKWLMGQRGSWPRMWVPRQKPSSGFVRK